METERSTGEILLSMKELAASMSGKNLRRSLQCISPLALTTDGGAYP